ncbi:hypothetical protein [Neomoorella thermoacetica]|uniref:hypothetical protein n=1 Tax=Neomoorella thermoacetica TaxID=1525 RepID=UPI000B2D54AC|nr:hypothetical protein [Moorella thermoacetica]
MLRARLNMGSRRQRRGWPWWLTLLAYPMGLLDGYLLSWWLRRRQQQEPAG